MIVDNLSIVVPIYNSGKSLPLLISALTEILPSLAKQYEVVLVNDGSRDNSWSVICELKSHHSWLCGINLMRNYGQHNALLCGIRAAHYDVIVTMDDDLQHPPEEIPKLLEKLAEGYDVVYGTPEQEQHSLWRDLASQITKLALQSAMGVSVARKVSAFRVFRTQTREAFSVYQSVFVNIDVLLTWGTTRFGYVLVKHVPREIGVSNYTFRKLMIHALNMVTGFTALPLQLASFIGFLFTLFGFGVFIFVLGRYVISGSEVPGFPFLAAIIAIFSGSQLFALGIIGEYISRIHFRSMDRPSYVIRSTISKDIPVTEFTV